MSSDLTDIHAALAKYLTDMTLPDYKRDTEKPTNVVWLLNNLKTKNSSSQYYAQTMLMLCQLAEAKNLLKAKALKTIRESLLHTQASVGSDTVRQTSKDTNLYSYQRGLVETLKTKTQDIVLFS